MVSLHVEPTTRCTLACPRCERTTFIEKFGRKRLGIQDLDIDSFEKFIDQPVDKIAFCGNLGDPIYHSRFIELVQRTKKLCNEIRITTNGSRKSTDWWNELVSVLDHGDKITFSIDGMPDNFDQYRVNADWASIENAIGITANSAVKTQWKWITFKYNETQVESGRELALKLGIDQFKVIQSDRWLVGDDPLKPTNQHSIDPRYHTAIQSFHSDKRDLDIQPQCSNNQSHYIDAHGVYAPCCESRHYSFWYKTDWYKNPMTIHNNRLSECIRRFDKFYATIQDTKPEYCVYNCGKC